MGVSSWCEVEVLVRKRLHRRCVVRLPESAMQAAPLNMSDSVPSERKLLRRTTTPQLTYQKSGGKLFQFQENHAQLLGFSLHCRE